MKKLFPQILAVRKWETQNPSQPLHASKSNMATLGDEDKSSSASSESRSSWYLVQVSWLRQLSGYTISVRKERIEIACIFAERIMSKILTAQNLWRFY